ncbi:MAG: hypothetical protein Kow00102_14530 [Spirochaetota bacterium]
MLHNTLHNPFTKTYQNYYQELLSSTQSKEVAACLKDFSCIDDTEIIHTMTNDLSNTLKIYTRKLKNESIQAITLLIDAPEQEYFIPSIILASAYEGYIIKKTYSDPTHPLLPKAENIYNELNFTNPIFSQFGGCDIDMISDILFDVISLPEIAKSKLLQVQTLVIIKILELLYNSCLLLLQEKIFMQLPKNYPFAFFAHLDNQEYIYLTACD